MTDIVGKVNEWLDVAMTEQKVWEDKAKENLRFYASKQWDTASLEVLKREKRPALTINKIFPIINFLSGYQRQNRYDIIINPRKNATKPEAEILTEIIKQILDVNNGDLEMSKVFLDGIITGRGWITGYIDYSSDPINGDLKLERVNPFNIYPDPDFTKYDLSDADFVIKIVNLSFDRIRLEFPDKIDELNKTHLPSQIISFTGGERKLYEENQELGNSVLRDSKVQVVECWYKTQKNTFYLIDPATGNYFEVEDKEKIKEAITFNPSLQVITRVKDILNLATVCGDVLLQNIEKPLGDFNKFPFVPFFCYKLDKIEDIQDTEIGIIDNLKDIQQEINKRRSQQLHIINTLAHSGWLNKKGEGADIKQLKNFGSTPGAVIEYQNVPPQRITPAPPSQGHILTEEEATKDLKEISGINPDLLGYKSERQEPGIVLQLRQQQGIVIIESLFDNFRFTHKLLGQYLIEIITKSKLYSPDEVVNIIDVSENPGKAQVINQLFTEPHLKKYDVVVNLQPSSPTLRLLNFYKLIEIAKMIPIPPDILIKASDIPYKEEILERLKQIQQGSPAPINEAGSNTATPQPNIVGEI